MTAEGRRPRRTFLIALIAFWLVCLEAGSYLIAYLSPSILHEPIRRRADILRDQSSRIAMLLSPTRSHREVLDSLLGWRYRTGFTSPTDHINEQGVRSRRVYGQPVPGRLRIAAFGDSFVYGNEVADDDAWPALLEACAGDYDVFNYGVGGYGLDQAYLRFEDEGMALEPRVVLIGFTPDDLRRVVNVFRRFISSLELPLAKPRFVLQDGQSLRLLPNPLPDRASYERLLTRPGAVRELGRFDEWYSPTIYENPLYDLSATIRVAHAVAQRLNRRYLDPHRLFIGEMFNEHSQAFALQTAILREFDRAVRARGAVPVIVMLPDRGAVDRARGGERVSYAPLTSALRSSGATVWDAAEAFAATQTPDELLFASGGHYGPRGNRVVAEWLLGRLDALSHHPQRVCDGSS